MLGSLKYKVAVLIIAVALLACAVIATYAVNSLNNNEDSRYQQHISAQQLSDLSAEDQEAASSLSTDPETFATHLPLVSIDTNGQTIPGAPASEVESTSATDETDAVAQAETTVTTSFKLFSREGANRLTDTPAVESSAQICYRGHSSRHFDKKSYQMQLTLSDGLTENKQDLLDMGEDDEWVLSGPFLDKTLIRNYLALNLAGQIMGVASEVRFCELFVDGAYQGVYLLMQPASKAVSRDVVYSLGVNNAQTGYIIKRDWEDASDPTNFKDFLNNTKKAWSETAVSVEYPAQSVITQDQLDFIQSDLNALEKTLYSYDYDSLTYGYKTMLDTDSFVDYFVINEFAHNTDAGLYSTYYYRANGGKLCIGPVWDFNNAFDNSMESAADSNGFIMVSKPLYYMLCKDEGFTERVIERYRELRQGVLSDDYLSSYIDDVVDYLGPAIERNYEVWGYSFDTSAVDGNNKLSPDERNPENYEESIDQLKSYIYKRGAWLDEYIENIKQYSQESAVKKYN